MNDPHPTLDLDDFEMTNAALNSVHTQEVVFLISDTHCMADGVQSCRALSDLRD